MHAAWGGGGHKIRTMTDKGVRGGEPNVLPDVLWKWPNRATLKYYIRHWFYKTLIYTKCM